METFDRYAASLSQLSAPFDPTIPTEEGDQIRSLAFGLDELPVVDRAALAAFVQERPEARERIWAFRTRLVQGSKVATVRPHLVT